MEMNGPQIEIENLDSGVERIKLKRQLGVVYGVAIIIGLVAGGGLFITSPLILKYTGSPGLSLVMWVCGGIITIFGGLSYAEMGVNFPHAGEKYVYIQEMCGSFWATAYMWQYVLIQRGGSNAVKILMVGSYILKPLYPDCYIPQILINLVATLLAILLGVLNCLNVKSVARSQSLFTSISISSMLFVITLGIYYAISNNIENLSHPFENSTPTPENLTKAFLSTIFSFGGYTAINFMVEEVKNPKRVIPISLVVSCSLLMVFYVLVNLSFFILLDRGEVLKSEAIAISAAMKVWSPLGLVMSLCIALTGLASSNSGLLVGSRLSFAAAREGHLPYVLSFLGVRHVAPVIAVILQSLVMIVYIWVVNLDFIINNVTFVVKFFDAMVAVSYIRLRIKERKISNENKIKMPLIVHIIYAMLSLFTVLANLVSNFQSSTIVFSILMSFSSVYYFIFIMWRPTFIRRNKNIDKLYVFVQKLFYCAPGDKCD